MSNKLSYELTDFELAQNRPVGMNIERMLSDIGTGWLQLDAMYQRDPCWSIWMKQALIKSIFARIPIGAIHLVQKEPDSGFSNVLDGKQRLIAVRDFGKGLFSIKWEGKTLDFIALQKRENKHYLDLFLGYMPQVVKWGFMSLLKQRQLFEVINSTAALNACEKIYCPNFFARALLKYLYNNCFHTVLEHCRNEIKTDKRFGGVQWTHRILLLLFGDSLLDSYAIRRINKEALTNSARLLDDKLCDYFSRSNHIEDFDHKLITPTVIDYLGITERVSLVKQTISSINSCLNYQRPWSKKIDSVTMMDFIVFTMKKVTRNILTPASMIEEAPKLHAFYDLYMQEKFTNNLGRHTTDIASITTREELFETMFQKIDIDKRLKNKTVPVHKRTEALMNAQPWCPVTGEALCDDNICVDHIDPKAIAGGTSYRAISKGANRRKSCNTKDKLTKMAGL